MDLEQVLLFNAQYVKIIKSFIILISHVIEHLLSVMKENIVQVITVLKANARITKTVHLIGNHVSRVNVWTPVPIKPVQIANTGNAILYNLLESVFQGPNHNAKTKNGYA